MDGREEAQHRRGEGGNAGPSVLSLWSSVPLDLTRLCIAVSSHFNTLRISTSFRFFGTLLGSLLVPTLYPMLKAMGGGGCLGLVYSGCFLNGFHLLHLHVQVL